MQMAGKPDPQHVERRNGHATIGEEAEPKGYPTSDRYQAETAHAEETDDHTRTDKPNRGK